jgi:mycothiol synthase
VSVTLRPPTFEDVPAIVRLLDAAANSTGLGVTTDADVRSWFTTPTFDVENNFRVAVADDGRLVGYADLTDPGDEHTAFFLDLRVPPRERDAGGAEALLAWAEKRAAALATGEAQISQGILTPNEYGRGLLERNGFAPIRYSYEMGIDLHEEPPGPDWPDGIAVRSFEVGRDERAVWAAQQEIFRDSWNFHEQPYEEWAHFTLRPDEFDPALNFLALDGSDEIAGIALCSESSTRRPDYGWVNILGVRRPWRKRGLGLALLRQSLGALHGRGKASVGLGVDAESPTGATRLYERAGMRRIDQMAIYAKTIQGGVR